MSELHTFSVAQLAAGLKNKDFSSTELTKHFLNRIAQHDKAINSFITVTPEQALAQASAADKLLAEGKGADLTG
ncbi:MAG: amidase family protein, partial [Moraxella sp.]